MIGFSLGAHISGIGERAINNAMHVPSWKRINRISGGKKVQSGKIGKIVGLDPAAPMFSMDKPERRLDITDAEYVEIIHTSKLGFFDLLGTVSFYVNGGLHQPRCGLKLIVSLYKKNRYLSNWLIGVFKDLST